MGQPTASIRHQQFMLMGAGSGDGSGGGGPAAPGFEAAVKTANYTITGNEDIGVDSTGGAFTIELKPSPVVGDYAIIRDVAQHCGTDAVLIDRNGSTINGAADDESLNIDSGIYWFIYNGSTWLFTPITPGGLNQTAVDARVVEVASGAKRLWLRPDAELKTPNVDPATLTSLVFSAGAAPSEIAVYSLAATAPNDYFYTTFVVPPSWALGATQIRSRVVYAVSTTGAGDIVFNVREAHTPFGTVLPVSVFMQAYGPFAAPGVALRPQVTGWRQLSALTGLAEGDLLHVQWYRIGGDVTDTYAGLLYVLGVEFEIITEAPTDD